MNITSSELSRLQKLGANFKTSVKTSKRPKCDLSEVTSVQRDWSAQVTLPFPPSVNRMYGRSMCGRVYLLKAGEKYKAEVATMLLMSGFNKRGGILEKVKISIKVFEPDFRKRDIDNLLKASLDSMKGYVYGDDWQISEIAIARHSVDRERPRLECDINTIQYRCNKV